MILGVLSDTHSLILPPQLLQALKKTDLIIHAGDICDAETLALLKGLGPTVKAVQGNMDDPPLKKKLPMKELFEAEGVKVGIGHGHGMNREIMDNLKDMFKDEDPDLIIFGHSHQPLNQKTGKTLYFNPGSPNDVCRAPYFSYGKIELKSGKIRAEIIKI